LTAWLAMICLRTGKREIRGIASKGGAGRPRCQVQAGAGVTHAAYNLLQNLI
jgi:hypothetical protein